MIKINSLICTAVIFSFLYFGGNSLSDVSSYSNNLSWLDNKIGIDHSVPLPWTPVKVTGNNVSVWNRDYQFENSPFPNNIKISGKSILNSPIVLGGAYDDGKDILWGRSKTQFIEKREDLATFKIKNESAKIILDGKVSIEFDGMIRIDITLTPKEKNVTIEELYLKLPLKKEFATLKYLIIDPDRTWDYWKTSLSELSGNVPDRWESKFIPYIWLGNEDAGLCWFAESDRNWRLKDENKAINLTKYDREVLLKINLINVRTNLNAPLTYTFGIQATPVKTLPDNWLLFREYRPGLKSKSNMFAPQFAQAYKYLGFPLVKDKIEVPKYFLGTKNISTYSDWVKDFHGMGIKFLTYVFVNSAFSELPQFKVNEKEWSCFGHKDPMDYSTNPELRGKPIVSVCPKSSWKDFYIYHLKDFISRYKVDGIYVDHGSLVACYNPNHGCTFEQNGKIKPSYPIFETRELHKRIYKFIKSSNKDSLIIHHTGGAVFIPLASFADAYLEGEPLWGVVDSDKYKGDYSKAVPLDVFKTQFTGKKWGVVPLFLPELRKEKYNTIENTETMVALCLLHGTNIYYGVSQHFAVTDKVFKSLDEFGMNSVRFLPYWENEELAGASSGNIKVSIYSKNGKALLVVSNLGEKDKTLDIKIDIAKFGLNGKKLKVEDVYSGEEVSWNDSKLGLTIKRKNFRLILLSEE